jgi:Zn-finger nucleic acid-binding protein
MKCPACGNNLSPLTSGNVTVDVCDNGCGGIWFDQFELARVDEPYEKAGEALLNIPRNPNVVVDQKKRYMCPKCTGIVMMRHFTSVARKVLIDECPKCAGHWLDAGELAAIRDEYNCADESEKAAEKYFAEKFNVQLEKMDAADRQKAHHSIKQVFQKLGMNI